MWYIHTIEYYPAIKREQITDTDHNMVESQNHYAKWEKPGT